jgi:hypothetical protein
LASQPCRARHGMGNKFGAILFERFGAPPVPLKPKRARCAVSDPKPGWHEGVQGPHPQGTAADNCRHVTGNTVAPGSVTQGFGIESQDVRACGPLLAVPHRTKKSRTALQVWLAGAQPAFTCRPEGRLWRGSGVAASGISGAAAPSLRRVATQPRTTNPAYPNSAYVCSGTDFGGGRQSLMEKRAPAHWLSSLSTFLITPVAVRSRQCRCRSCAGLG